jgi:hypothetical protein
VVQKITKLGRVNPVVGDETVWVVDDVAGIKRSRYIDVSNEAIFTPDT